MGNIKINKWSRTRPYNAWCYVQMCKYDAKSSNLIAVSKDTIFLPVVNNYPQLIHLPLVPHIWRPAYFHVRNPYT